MSLRETRSCLSAARLASPRLTSPLSESRRRKRFLRAACSVLYSCVRLCVCCGSGCCCRCYRLLLLLPSPHSRLTLCSRRARCAVGFAQSASRCAVLVTICIPHLVRAFLAALLSSSSSPLIVVAVAVAVAPHPPTVLFGFLQFFACNFAFCNVRVQRAAQCKIEKKIQKYEKW